MKLLLIAILAVGCRGNGKQLKPFGSACTRDDECGTGGRFFCAPYHPGGYCAAECRGDGDCAGGVCVRADPVSYGHCHARCAANSDCRRPGYLCVMKSKDADAPYCDPPGSRHIMRRLRGGWWR